MGTEPLNSSIVTDQPSISSRAANPLSSRFRQSHAVIIGVSRYQQLQTLTTPPHDARHLADILAEPVHGYTVHAPLIDPTYAQLKELFDRRLPEWIEAGDRLLLYYAGHGIARNNRQNIPTGYILPVDARRDSTSHSISMEYMYRALSKLPCKHLLLVLDCCFAGAFRWSDKQAVRSMGLMPNRIFRQRFDRYVEDPAWQVITSAAYNQQALDICHQQALGDRSETGRQHSPFALHFFEGLKGAADLIPSETQEKDGLITATELYLYLRQQTEVQTIAIDEGLRQTPRLHNMARHDRGEYLFLSPRHPLNLPDLDLLQNPYKGLAAYDLADSERFFGRERVISSLLEKFDQQNLLLIVGPSGTGKSSVIKAGLAPRLMERGYKVRIMRPGKAPLDSLAAAGPLPAPRTVLVIDQLEELITQGASVEQRTEFMAQLAQLLKQEAEKFHIVLTLRSDFEPQLAASVLQDQWEKARYVIPGFSLEELREVIVRPATQNVLYFDPPELVNQILEDVAQAPGVMPLLSFTLNELFESYRAAGLSQGERSLKAEYYRKMGRVTGALQASGNRVYDSLDLDHQATLRRLTLRMLSLEGAEPAGRRVFNAQLQFEDAAENARVSTVTEALLDRRLIVRGLDHNGQVYIEPAHDALVRTWDKPRQWIDQYGKNTLLLLDDFRSTIISYETHDTSDALLWDDDPRLEQLQVLAKKEPLLLNSQEHHFLQLSLQARIRKRKRVIRNLTAVIGTLLILSVVAIWFGINANLQQQQAEVNAAAFLANNYMDEGDGNTAVHLLRQAYQTDPDNPNVAVGISRIGTGNGNLFRAIGPDYFYGIALNPKKRQALLQNQNDRDEDYVSILDESGSEIARSRPNTDIPTFSYLLNRIGDNDAGNYASHSYWNHQQNKLLLKDTSGTYAIWHIEADTYQEIPRAESGILELGWSHNGNHLLGISQDLQQVRLWSAAGEVIGQVELPGDSIRSVTFLPHEAGVAIFSKQGGLSTWDLQGRLLHQRELNTSSREKGYIQLVTPGLLAFQQDDQLWLLREDLSLITRQPIACCSTEAAVWLEKQQKLIWDKDDHQLGVYDLADQQLATHSIPGDEPIDYLLLSPDEKHLVVVFSSQLLILNEELQERTRYQHFSDFDEVKVAPSGQYLLINRPREDNSLQIIDLNGKLLAEFGEANDYIEEPTFLFQDFAIIMGAGQGILWNWRPPALVYSGKYMEEELTEEEDVYDEYEVQIAGRYLFQVYSGFYDAEDLGFEAAAIVPLGTLARVLLPEGKMIPFPDTIQDITSLDETILSERGERVVLSYDEAFHLFSVSDTVRKLLDFPTESSVGLPFFQSDGDLVSIQQMDDEISCTVYPRENAGDKLVFRAPGQGIDLSAMENFQTNPERTVILFSSEAEPAALLINTALRQIRAFSMDTTGAPLSASPLRLLANGQWLGLTVKSTADSLTENTHLWELGTLFQSERSTLPQPDRILEGPVEALGPFLKLHREHAQAVLDPALNPLFEVPAEHTLIVSESGNRLLSYTEAAIPDQEWPVFTVWSDRGRVLGRATSSAVNHIDFFDFKIAPSGDRILGERTDEEGYVLWNETGEVLAFLDRSDGICMGWSDFAEEQGLLATSCYDGLTYLWNQDGNLMGSYPGDTTFVYETLFFNHDEYLLIESLSGYSVWRVNQQDIMEQLNWIDPPPAEVDLLNFLR